MGARVLQNFANVARRIRLSAAAAHGASKHKRRRRTARRDGERRPLEKSYKPKKLYVNDTRRRPATVAVAVCIGRYARIIFFMVRFRERDVLKRSRFQAGEARGSKKKNNVQAVLRQEKHKQLQDTFD